MQAILALEDGRYFEGSAFGQKGTTTGEICFNTSMTGYQEILTDPSYRGQIVTFTYPLIGNYGINPHDVESDSIQVRGLVIEELARLNSSWRSTQSLASYCASQGVLGIEHIDTRAVTKHLRCRGSMRCCMSTELTVPQAIEAAKKAPSMEGANFLEEVGVKEITPWQGDSRPWLLPNVAQNQSNYWGELPPITHHIVAYDFGIKHNILRNLRRVGFEVTLVPSNTPAQTVLDMKPQGVFLSNGPGDPAALTKLHTTVRDLLGNVPIFGICLGHQLITHAVGGKTFKLKFGHRGANHPIKDLRTSKVIISSQNHGFATDPDSLPEDIEITHINLNDHTVAGISHRKYPAFSVQYHPEASPGPHDALYFFKDFIKLIDQSQP